MYYIHFNMEKNLKPTKENPEKNKPQAYEG